MTNRYATLMIADDVHVDLTGKFMILGVYTGDIQIPVEPSTVPRLVFVFTIETDIKDPFRSMIVEVTLPGTSPAQWPVQLIQRPILPGHTRIVLRLPFLVLMPVLRQGHIEAKVIHENGAIVVSSPWIVVASRPPNAPPS